MKDVWRKLINVKSYTKSIYRGQYGGISDKIKDARSALSLIQQEMQEELTNVYLKGKEKEAHMGPRNWLEIEESVCSQKSRVDWLKLGDDNITFFTAIKERNCRNKIVVLKDENRNKLENL